MKRYGVDSWESWKIMVLTGPMYMCVAASIRVGGFVFVGLLRDFILTRQEASWPLSVQSFFVQVAAPIVTILRQWISHLTILRASALISSLALMLCYFAQDLFTLTVLYIIHGSAQAGFFTSINVILSGHFNKRRSTATGLAMTISASSMLYLPAIFSYCLNEYGTRGSLLLLGAVSLHAFVISLAIHENKFIEPGEKRPSELASVKDERDVVSVASRIVASDPHMVNSDEVEKSRSRCSSMICDTGSVACIESSDKSPIEDKAPEIVSNTKADTNQKTKGFSEVLHSLLTLTFFMDTFSFSVIFTTMITFYTVTVDFTTDKGLSEISMWCFSSYCAGDLIFRGTAGFFVDSKLLSTTAVMALGFAVQSVALTMYTLSTSVIGVLSSCFFMGASNGARLALFVIILIADFGLPALTHTLSFSNFINGFVGLTRPPLVGYFRDVLNDYNGMFLSFAAVNIIFTCLWTIRWLRSKC